MSKIEFPNFKKLGLGRAISDVFILLSTLLVSTFCRSTFQASTKKWSTRQTQWRCHVFTTQVICIYLYTYVHICTHMYTYVYICTYFTSQFTLVRRGIAYMTIFYTSESTNVSRYTHTYYIRMLLCMYFFIRYMHTYKKIRIYDVYQHMYVSLWKHCIGNELILRVQLNEFISVTWSSVVISLSSTCLSTWNTNFVSYDTNFVMQINDRICAIEDFLHICVARQSFVSYDIKFVLRVNTPLKPIYTDSDFDSVGCDSRIRHCQNHRSCKQALKKIGL
jgi:hypothetical protein